MRFVIDRKNGIKRKSAFVCRQKVITDDLKTV